MPIAEDVYSLYYAVKKIETTQSYSKKETHHSLSLRRTTTTAVVVNTVRGHYTIIPSQSSICISKSARVI